MLFRRTEVIVFLRDRNLKSVFLAFVLVLFFGPLGLFYAGVGWGLLALMFSFIFMVIGCAVGLLFGDPGGWIDLDSIAVPVFAFGIIFGWGMMYLISLVVGPVVVHYKRQYQLDEIEELEAYENKAANRYRPKRRHCSYT